MTGPTTGHSSGGGFTLLDVQWATPHLTSLGTREITRRDYLARLGEAVGTPARF